MRTGYILAAILLGGAGGRVAGAKTLALEMRPTLLAVATRLPIGSLVEDRYTSADGTTAEAQGRASERQVAGSVQTPGFDRQMPEPMALLLFGTGLFGASGLCVYRASRTNEMRAGVP